MKNTIILIALFGATFIANSQKIYTKTFGNSKSKPIIFLHGGPGYNSVSFEVTTAQKIADNDFYVIVYDRRGEGRSEDKNAKFTFQETFDDLNEIYKKFSLKRATLIGHSFGGIITTLFAEKYPKSINSIILVSAPISLPETFKTIIKSIKSIYQTKKDDTNLNYINMLEKMDSNSIEYSSYCFAHAMQNGFYSTRNPNDLAKNIYATFRTDTLLSKYASKMDYIAPQGFWKNEKYTTINLTENLKVLKSKNLKIYSLFGKEDGLYSAEQIAKTENIVGISNNKYLENCSHNVFIDQQKIFIETLKKWTNK